jgi:CheY-like chemotaxis protein
MKEIRILIVEDEAVTAMAIRKSLSGLGYRLSDVASSGEEALKKIDAARPDLILMDIVLQGAMDGIEAASHIRAHYDIPVVYTT